jgi:(4-(4-[2-(gamma-L-glutamylamino)ethyl]phenoxymethyl)furan-2-yl)methanamine synthase
MICIPYSIAAETDMTSSRRIVLGWDIGGVNTKAARVESSREGPVGLRAVNEPYELQRAADALVPTLARLARHLLNGERADVHAVTMTAELSQLFRTKREGVGFVMDAVESAFPHDPIAVYTVNGDYITPIEARRRPLEVAASNWAATAALVAGFEPDALVIDTGSTTTDIIPVSGGKVRAAGRTDPARLQSGELVYTGAVRTPAEALVQHVPLPGGDTAVSAEGFALVGDAHVWLGRLAPESYTASTPDGRPVTREFAGERLARLVCADREMLDDAAINAIATALAEAQVRRIIEGIGSVRARWPAITRAVVTGLGAFVAAEAAERAGLTVVALSDRLGDAALTAPAAAVAWLLAARRPIETA